MIKYIYILPVIALFSCISYRIPDIDRASFLVYDDPSQYLDQEVTVCGYRFNGTLLLSADTNLPNHVPSIGLGLKNSKKPKVYPKFKCYTGKVIYTGCSTERICTGSTSDYALNNAIIVRKR